MRSTFMGLETNKRGLFTQQSALYTTGHNISNANTLGYSRQRVNMQATAGFPGTGLNAGTMPGFLGTGVEAGSIQRIRDSFVDQQFRQESNKLGYWESRSQAITQMEDVLNEPSHYGLAKSLSEFWQSLHDLSVNPENGGARAVVVNRGIAVAESFNYMHKSLSAIQTNLGKEIGVATVEVNSILEQIADLNRQIAEVEPNGYMPNDLYDVRDLLLDQLSTFFPIETSYTKSGGRALAISEGSVTVKVKLKDGSMIEVVNGRDYSTLSLDNSDSDGYPTGPENVLNFTFNGSGNIVGGPMEVSNMISSGKLKSLVDSYGYDTGTTDALGNKIVTGLYPEMLAKLDKMAEEFATAFNNVHTDGTDLEGAAGEIFFVVNGTSDAIGLTAGNIYVNQQLIDDPSKLAASDSIPVATPGPGEGEEGNGKNAKKLADVQFATIGALGSSTIQSYFQGIIGQLGVDGLHAERLAFNTATLKNAVEHRRASISSVSLDEEMTDMIKYQQAYNASARMITVIDETLDKIINGMGRVGM